MKYEYRRPYLYPAQRAALFDPRRISLIEASTKSGKTAGAIVWLYEEALRGKSGQNFWWAAPVSLQARIAFNRMRASFTDAKGHPLFNVNLTDHALTLPNGAIISFRSGDHPDSLYGEDVHACVIDEASRFKQEAWHAIRSTLTATRGRMRIIGNVKGRKNWFYALARRAESGGDPRLGYHKLTAYDAVSAGVLDEEEIEEARQTYPEHIFRELYLAEPSDDEGNPFGIERINACVGVLSKRPPSVWGWDLARKADWTVGIALDAMGAVCRIHRWRMKPWGEQIEEIKREVGLCPALVDETGVGDAIVEALKRASVPAPGLRGQVQAACPLLEGYRFTGPSKQVLMEGLAAAIHQRQLRFPEGPIAMELRQFEYEIMPGGGVRYSAPEGMYDDCVCALALAQHARTNRKYRYDHTGAWVGEMPFGLQPGLL